MDRPLIVENAEKDAEESSTKTRNFFLQISRFEHFKSIDHCSMKLIEATILVYVPQRSYYVGFHINGS